MNQIILRMASRRLAMKTEVCLLLPSVRADRTPENEYAFTGPFRVLWLLHGATCDYQDFLYHDRVLPMLEQRHVMVVMPNGLNADYANHMEFANGYAYTDFFFEELMPYIYANFPASRSPKENFLAGYSMGGAGALMYGLYRPELFGQVAVLGASMRESDFLKPYLLLTGEAFRRLAMQDPRRFPTEYGDPAQGITRKEINMIARYDTVQDYVNSMECTGERFRDAVENGMLPRLLFCCGELDGCCEKVRQIQDYVRENKLQNVAFEIIPGYGHDRGDVAIRRAIERMEL